MDVKSYLQKAEVIRKNELMSVMDLVREINISFDTLRRIKARPETCSLRTMRRLKAFVDERSNKGVVYGPAANDE